MSSGSPTQRNSFATISKARSGPVNVPRRWGTKGIVVSGDLGSAGIEECDHFANKQRAPATCEIAYAADAPAGMLSGECDDRRSGGAEYPIEDLSLPAAEE
jgi:hypothetical protein